MNSQWTDIQIKELLEEAFKKIDSKRLQDTTALSDRITILNWILTVITILFVFYTSQPSLTHTCFEYIILECSEVLFIILIVTLLLHQVIAMKYESIKLSYLENLRTHFLELKFDIFRVKAKYNFNEPVFVVDFINSFRKGKFISHPSDERVEGFTKFDKRLEIYGAVLKVLFLTSFSSFCLYFLGVIILLLWK